MTATKKIHFTTSSGKTGTVSVKVPVVGSIFKVAEQALAAYGITDIKRMASLTI